MARRSSAAVALQERDIDVDYSERAGFLTGKSAAIAEWRFRKEQGDPKFRQLVWRLQAKKYWAAKSPDRKARIYAYRRQWAKEHPERVRAMMVRAHRKFRSDPRNREHEARQKREKRAVGSQARRAATVYTCVVCGAQWSPVGRIPTRPPIYNSLSCRNRVQYARARAAGKR